MKLLLDTCAFLWVNSDSTRLSALAKALCADPENELYLSVVSAWEITVKYMAKRLWLAEPAAQYIPARRAVNRITSLDLNEEIVLQLSKLPPIHGDPFDRMLVCQALVHGLAILTPDEWIAKYPVRVLW